MRISAPSAWLKINLSVRLSFSAVGVATDHFELLEKFQLSRP